MPPRRTATELLRDLSDRTRPTSTRSLDQSSLEHFNPNTGGAVWIGPTGQLSELDVEGKRLQSRALERYEELLANLRVLLRAQPPEVLATLEETDAQLRPIILHDMSERTMDDVRAHAHEALDEQFALLDRLYDAGTGVDIFVADTNALLYNPALDDWAFARG